jgi:ABC-type sulfate transport system permease subunit
MKTKMVMIALVISMIVNCAFIAEKAIPYYKMRLLAYEEAEKYIGTEELAKYRIRDIKKDVRWHIIYENLEPTFDGDHFLIILENGQVTLVPGM